MNYHKLIWKNRYKELRLASRLWRRSHNGKKPKGGRPLFVAMIDGSYNHGGLCDRLKGIVSLYAYCKYNHLPFRIKYTFPYELSEILIPSNYDWRLQEGEYSDNPFFTRVLFMKREFKADRLLKLKTKRQIHFYGNRDLLPCINQFYSEKGENPDYDWGTLFRELFEPSDLLKRKIQLTKEKIGENYIAAVFRFQNLLGDFKEYDFQELPDDQKEGLIKKCIAGLKDIMAKHKEEKFLVTSDSASFLMEAAKIEKVHIIPGKLTHMDQVQESKDNDLYESHLKSFVDFFMLSDAKKIYRMSTSLMYPTQFPLYASKVHNIPFESIELE